MEGMKRIVFALCASLLLGGLPVAAQDDLPHVLGVDFTIGTPSSFQDIFRSVSLGASVRWLATDRIEVSLDYFYLGKEFYYPDSGDWYGPVPWTSVPSGDIHAYDWIFYHTRHYIAPKAWYLVPLDALSEAGDFDLRLGTGPALNFIIPSEAAIYYPELADAFEQFEKTFDAYLGWTVNVGLEYHPVPLVALGFEYMFLIDDFTKIAYSMSQDWLGYLDKAGNFVFYVGMRI